MAFGSELNRFDSLKGPSFSPSALEWIWALGISVGFFFPSHGNPLEGD